MRMARQLAHFEQSAGVRAVLLQRQVPEATDALQVEPLESDVSVDVHVATIPGSQAS